MLLLLLLAALGGAVTGFPVTELSVTQAWVDTFSNASAAQSSAMATTAVTAALRGVFGPSSQLLEMQPADVSAISGSLPDQVVDNSCSHTVTAEHPHGTGQLLNSSYLRFGVNNITWKEISVFADARVDATLDIDSGIKVEVGKHIFGHHCTHFGHKTVDVKVDSHGRNGVGINMTASNATLQKDPTRPGVLDLVFDFHADVVGLVLSWDVSDVVVNHCKIEILGIKIGSYCGLLERLIKNGVNKLSAKATKLVAPKLQEKLEKAINTAIGSQVRIPLKL